MTSDAVMALSHTHTASILQSHHELVVPHTMISSAVTLNQALHPVATDDPFIYISIAEPVCVIT